MQPPNPRPIPRFIADSTQEGIPHGRFAERLAESFGKAWHAVEGLPEGVEGLPEGVEAPAELDRETVDQESFRRPLRPPRA